MLKILKIKQLIFQADCGTQNRLGSKQGHAITCVVYNNSWSGYCWAECQPSLLDGRADGWHPFPEAYGSTATSTGLSIWRFERRVSKSAWESAWGLIQSQNGNSWFPWYFGSEVDQRFANFVQRSPWWGYQQHHPRHQPGRHLAPNNFFCQLDYLRHLVLSSIFLQKLFIIFF